MEVSTTFLKVFVILGFIHYVPAQKLFTLNTPNFDLHDSDWEKQLETGIVALEANCNDNNFPINREKVTKDLRNCLHPVITQDAFHIDPFQKHLTHDELFRQIYIEPVCNKVSMSMECLKPHRKIIENCARDDGKTLQEILKSACTRNGTKIVEFVKEGGFQCITSRADEFAGCFKTNNEKESLTSSSQVCSYFRSVRDCAISVFFKCETKIPGKIIKSIFDEVHTETSGRCLGAVQDHENNSNTSSSNFQNISFILLTLISLFLPFRL